MVHRRALAALGIAAALLGLTAAPVSADDHDLVVVFSGPSQNEVLGASTILVSGRVEGRAGLLDTRVEGITVTVVRDGGGGLEQIGNDRRPPEFAARFAARRNGRYTATVQATGRGQVPLLGVGVTSVRGSGTRSFGVAAPPRAPQDVKVDVSPERVATISWARNPEPDILHYALFRKDPGSNTFRRVGGDLKQPASGRPSYVDSETAGSGGDYSYQVVAVRQGADERSSVNSAASAPRTVSVSAPPPTSAPGADGAGGDGPAGPAAGAGTAPRADISAFLAARPGPSLPAPPRVLELPDTGFSESLPFGSLPALEELEEGEEEAEPRTFEVETTTEFVTRGRPLVPVAAGAVLLLLAMHLRLLNRRVKAGAPAAVTGPAHVDLAPLDLPVEEPAAPDRAVEASPAPEPPAVAPGAVLFDYEAVVERGGDVSDWTEHEWAEREWDDDEVREVVVSPAR